MNGSGIDDAEPSHKARWSIEKFAGKKSARALGEKSLMDHSFLFGRCYFLLHLRETRERYPGFIRDKEFMLANGIPDYFC